MLKPIDALVPDLLGARALVDLPPNLAIQHLREVAVELCAIAHVWKQTLTLDLQAGVTDYPIEPHDGAVLHMVEQVRVGACCLTPTRGGLCSGCMCHRFSVLENHTLRVPAPQEDQPDAVTLSVVVKPSRSACQIPEMIYEDWADVIVDGAAAKAYAMRGFPWFNSGMVTFYTKRYSVGRSRARAQTTLGRVNGPLMIRGSYF